MPRDPIDQVEIVEPPIGELTKNHFGLRRILFTGCLAIVIFIVGSIIAFRLAVGQGPTVLSKVPASFPQAIPVYDPDAIDRITFISGGYKNRAVEIAAFFPKLILSQLFLALNGNSPTTGNTADSGGGLNTLTKTWQLISTPVADHRDTIQIEWKNMDAEPTFVVNYYKNELRKKGYKIVQETTGNELKQFSFTNDDGVSGSLLAQGDETKKPGTDYAILTVNLPAPTP